MFYFSFETARSEAAACRYLNAYAVSEDDCRGDAIQRQNATTPNRATVPREGDVALLTAAAARLGVPAQGAARAAVGDNGDTGE